MDSYMSDPIVSPIEEPLCIAIGDVITAEDWLRFLSEGRREIELRVKVEDVRHLFWDRDDLVHQLAIKVTPIK